MMKKPIMTLLMVSMMMAAMVETAAATTAQEQKLVAETVAKEIQRMGIKGARINLKEPEIVALLIVIRKGNKVELEALVRAIVAEQMGTETP